MGKIEDEGAVVMRAAAAKAVNAAKAVMLDEIQRALPEDANPRNGGRQIGAMITACTMLYADMLDTFSEHGGKGEATLIAGMLKTLVEGPLLAVAKVAGGTAKINLRT